MTGAEVVAKLAQNSDPANFGLLAVVWWRLNRRLQRLEQSLGVQGDSKG